MSKYFEKRMQCLKVKIAGRACICKGDGGKQ